MISDEDKVNLTAILGDFEDVCGDADDAMASAVAVQQLGALDNFCDNLLAGKIENDDTYYDEVFANMTTACGSLQSFMDGGSVSAHFCFFFLDFLFSSRSDFLLLDTNWKWNTTSQQGQAWLKGQGQEVQKVTKGTVIWKHFGTINS